MHSIRGTPASKSVPTSACHLAIQGPTPTPTKPPFQLAISRYRGPARPLNKFAEKAGVPLMARSTIYPPVVHPHPSSSILILLSMPGIQPLVFIELSGLSHLRLPTHSSRFLSAILVSYSSPFLSITTSFIHKHALFARLLYTFLYNSQNFLLYRFPVSLENKLL